MCIIIINIFTSILSSLLGIIADKRSVLSIAVLIILIFMYIFGGGILYIEKIISDLNEIYIIGSLQRIEKTVNDIAQQNIQPSKGGETPPNNKKEDDDSSKTLKVIPYKPKFEPDLEVASNKISSKNDLDWEKSLNVVISKIENPTLFLNIYGNRTLMRDLFITQFDQNRNNVIDLPDEVASIPCVVFQRLSSANLDHRHFHMLSHFGLKKEYQWNGYEVGFSKYVKHEVYRKINDCNL